VQSIAGASYGLLAITLMMLALSILRTSTKGRLGEVWARLRQPASAT
jgi:hypothetical protein